MKLRGWLQQLQPLKHYVIAAAFVFILCVILGYVDSSSYEILIKAQMEQMQGIADGIKQSDHQQWSFFSHIILNNLLACAMAILFGFFFGLFPIYLLVSNGLFLGYVAANRGDEVTMLYFLKGILPHGIIEIPAFILACAVGMRFGSLVLQSIGGVFSLERKAKFQMKFRVFIRQLLPMVILIGGLMLLAAIIESTITYTLLK
ncbi:stage II sporulation protein M [Paenibacillus psychroresistens]|nr:stage II sporulation protein M [Paenibacillus psychroresistens]